LALDPGLLEEWDNVSSLLEMNKQSNKSEVARKKILRTVNIHTFVHMRESMLPFAIEWVGRDDLGFSLMYFVVQELPTLLDIRNFPH
jgi:hypothetical protein